MNLKIQANLTEDQESIIALSTPQGSGAIAVIRLSGDNVFDVVDSFTSLSSHKKFKNLQTHTIHHGFIVDCKKKSQRVDEVLFFLMRAPKTFTAQNTIEISCHNNPFIIEKIIKLACEFGARPARAGEFCKRAVLNGKINLLQAEAINELINAQNEVTLQMSMRQIIGTLSSFLAELENDFTSLLGLVEASFEFLAEEQADINLSNVINGKCLNLVDKLSKIQSNFSYQNQIRDGIKISLIGHVNAGKSTLFNALLGRDRAIVSDIEGTTRDSIEVSIWRNGVFWTFVDTAGIRQTHDSIELAGIQRSIQESDKSDIILLVLDISRKLGANDIEEYQKVLDKHADKTILVLNKIDKISTDVSSQFMHDCLVKISAESGFGIENLFLKINQKVDSMFEIKNSCFLLNQRHMRLLNEIWFRLNFIVNEHLVKLEYELVAYKIKEILELLSELTGRSIGEKVLDSVFKDFCIGK